MITTLQQQAAALSERLNVEVEPTPYAVGYWLRVAGQARPGHAEMARGWDVADRELAAQGGAR